MVLELVVRQGLLPEVLAVRQEVLEPILPGPERAVRLLGVEPERKELLVPLELCLLPDARLERQVPRLQGVVLERVVHPVGVEPEVRRDEEVPKRRLVPKDVVEPPVLEPTDVAAEQALERNPTLQTWLYGKPEARSALAEAAQEMC